MNGSKCYFHSERDMEKLCEFCKRPVCNVCLGESNECWACRFINYSKSQDRNIKIDTLRVKESKISHKKLIYIIPEIWIGNWGSSEFKMFSLLGTQFLSLPLKDEEVDIYYIDSDKKFVSTIWTKEKTETEFENPYLLYSAWNVRNYDSFLKKVLKFLLIVVAPLIIFYLFINFILFPLIRSFIFPGLFYIISPILMLILFLYLWNLFNKKVYPNFWADELSEIIGEVEDNLLGDKGVLEWKVIKKDGTLVNQGWKIFLRIRMDTNIKKRILIEGLGTAPQFIKENFNWRFITNDGLIIEKGKRYKFKGRDLFNVLVCNLSLRGKQRDESRIEEVR